MFLKSSLLTVLFLSSNASANEPLSVFSGCLKELNKEIREARAFIAKGRGIAQYDIIVSQPLNVGTKYFKVDYTILSGAYQVLSLEFKYWSDDQGLCHRVEFEDYIY